MLFFPSRQADNVDHNGDDDGDDVDDVDNIDKDSRRSENPRNPKAAWRSALRLSSNKTVKKKPGNGDGDGVTMLTPNTSHLKFQIAQFL